MPTCVLLRYGSGFVFRHVLVHIWIGMTPSRQRHHDRRGRHSGAVASAATGPRRPRRSRVVDRCATPFADSASRYAGAMIAPFCEAESAEPVVRDLGLAAAETLARALSGPDPARFARRCQRPRPKRTQAFCAPDAWVMRPLAKTAIAAVGAGSCRALHVGPLLSPMKRT